MSNRRSLVKVTPLPVEQTTKIKADCLVKIAMQRYTDIDKGHTTVIKRCRDIDQLQCMIVNKQARDTGEVTNLTKVNTPRNKTTCLYRCSKVVNKL